LIAYQLLKQVQQDAEYAPSASLNRGVIARRARSAAE